jgi:hypothetical protein
LSNNRTIHCFKFHHGDFKEKRSGKYYVTFGDVVGINRVLENFPTSYKFFNEVDMIARRVTNILKFRGILTSGSERLNEELKNKRERLKMQSFDGNIVKQNRTYRAEIRDIVLDAILHVVVTESDIPSQPNVCYWCGIFGYDLFHRFITHPLHP